MEAASQGRSDFKQPCGGDTNVCQGVRQEVSGPLVMVTLEGRGIERRILEERGGETVLCQDVIEPGTLEIAC